MPALLQRLRRSFQKRSRTSSRVTSPRVPPAQQKHGEQVEADVSDDDDLNSSGSSLPPLPVIQDAGPPTSNRYTSSDIFWNSVMVEANDHERTPWGAPRKASLARRYTDRSKTTEIEPQNVPYPQRPMQHMASGNKASTPQATGPKRKQNSTRGLQRLQRSLSYGKERADNDLTVMMFTLPDQARPRDAPTPLVERSPEPLSLGTQQWDEFMDFPTDNSLHRYPAEADSLPVVLERARSTPELASIPEERRQLSAAPITHAGVPALRDGPGNSTVWTWEYALNGMMNHEIVGPGVGHGIRERAETAESDSGRNSDDLFLVQTTEASLVPNFSYPIAAAAFYDRPPTDQPQIPLTNGVESAHNEMEEGKQEACTLLPTNGSSIVEPPQSAMHLLNGMSSSSSSVDIHGSLHRPKSPDWTNLAPQRIENLLKEVLTSSELSLCNEIIKASSTTSTLTPPTTPEDETDSNAASADNFETIRTTLNTHAHTDSTSPSLIRLVAKLHTLLHHLQDRATYLEDNLLPILGTALERKTFTIDVLSVEIQNLGDQIHQLKITVDFGNKILAGCWLREYEVWRTLVTIREKREQRIGKRLLRRLTGRRNRIADGVISPLGSTVNGNEMGSRKQMLRKKELEALILMAEQNVQVLREDVDDMVERVEKCKRNVRAYEAVPTPEEGSWRDV